MFLKASLHGTARLKERAGGVWGGGWGGGRSPPPICKHNVFMTGSERVDMGSVFAGKMIPKAILHILKKTGMHLPN